MRCEQEMKLRERGATVRYTWPGGEGVRVCLELGASGSSFFIFR